MCYHRRKLLMARGARLPLFRLWSSPHCSVPTFCHTNPPLNVTYAHDSNHYCHTMCLSAVMIIRMHISQLFYCHNLVPKSNGNNIAHHYLKLVLYCNTVQNEYWHWYCQYFSRGLLVLLLPILYKSIVNSPVVMSKNRSLK